MKRTCKTRKVKPTQFAVGEFEVKSKLRELEGGRRRRARAVRKHVVPVVLSPDGEVYALDHHHFVSAALIAGVKRVRIDVRADFTGRRISRPDFWKRMARKDWLYLYDQFGSGPREPLYLPPDMSGLSDDPYRSLAWMVREEGGFANEEYLYSAFKWTEFFRRRRLLKGCERRDLARVLPEALRLARSPSARGLPGYSGKTNEEAS
jgi:hypothetical protein